MSFLQPFFLWGLLAASIPIIIHLLNRRRHRTVQWAAMEFLLKATRESRGKKKLKYLIILACRTLAIAALIFAIARPFVGGFFGWSGGKIDTVILLLDRSASMEQLSQGGTASKRKSALINIKEALKELNSPRLILIDSATGEAQEVPDPDALDELTATSPTDTKSSIPTLISSAVDYILDHSPGQTEIWLASDLQKSDWAPEQEQWNAIRTGLTELPQKTKLRILSMSSSPKENSAIRVLSARRDSGNIVLDLEVSRSANTSTTTIPITFSVNGTRSADKITLKGQSYQFQKRIPLEKSAGSGFGFVSIPSDTNPRDNVSYFAYGENAPTKTFIVSEGGESLSWLALAAAPPEYGNNQSIILAPNAAHQIDWQNTSLIIWQAPLPTGPIAQEISRYIELGGTALFFPPATPSQTSFLGVHWGEQSVSPRGQYFIVDEWNHNEGPLRNGLDDTPIPADKIKAIRRTEIKGITTTLASWDDSKVFLARKVMGDGTAIFVGSLPDYTWSNLADGDVLLPLVQRSVELGNKRFNLAYSAIAGSKKAMTREGETRTRLDSYAKSDASNAPYEAGVWKLGDRILATNRPPSEDQWQTISEKSLAQLLEGVSYSLFEDQGESDSLTREIWRAFLVAMLIFMIIEAILCLQKKPKKSSSQ